jgi:8-oxo-dGTP pyrophosphatase MutT (NUDIX family)
VIWLKKPGLWSKGMQPRNQIRVKVLGLIRNGDRILVSKDYQPDVQKHYYRALGGSIEFGETSREALQREFQEELQAELINLQYLGCVENLFTYAGQRCHELIQFYQCDFVDRRFYQLEQVPFVDGASHETNQPGIAYWIECDRFKSGELWLVPEACLKFL